MKWKRCCFDIVPIIKLINKISDTKKQKRNRYNHYRSLCCGIFINFDLPQEDNNKVSSLGVHLLLLFISSIFLFYEFDLFVRSRSLADIKIKSFTLHIIFFLYILINLKSPSVNHSIDTPCNVVTLYANITGEMKNQKKNREQIFELNKCKYIKRSIDMGNASANQSS